MDSSISSVNINDFIILTKIDLGRIPKKNDYQCHSFHAIDKKSKEEVVLNIYEDYYDIEGKIDDIIPKPILFKLAGTVNVIKYQSPMTSKNKEKIIELFENYDPFGNYTLFITELMKIQRVENLNHDYIVSRGKKHEIINPTIRSKIIFGIASTMKKLHSYNAYLPNLFGKVCLDDKLEPRLRLTSITYFDLSKVKLVYTVMWGVGDDPSIIAPETLKSRENDPSLIDVFGFGMFVYSMFTDTTDEADFMIRYLHSREYLFKNSRPEKSCNIPDHYFDLIEKCLDEDPKKRPSFNEIVEILMNDKFALNEYSMKTNLDELHEYQSRIENY